VPAIKTLAIRSGVFFTHKTGLASKKREFNESIFNEMKTMISLE
jgi:hypothetical protein